MSAQIGASDVLFNHANGRDSSFSDGRRKMRRKIRRQKGQKRRKRMRELTQAYSTH